jgi:mercuric ion transport protein
MNKESLATGGAIAASFLIGSCCIMPTLFLVFGVSVGALGVLSALEPFQPIFIVVGFVSLSYAGLRIFRESSDPECDSESCDPQSRNRHRLRRIFPVAVLFFVAAISYPYILNALL